MSSQLTIAPVSRVEGHGKVTIDLDEQGAVIRSHFHVTEFRGFEKFCEGRLASEMPIITTRICGICPVSHHLASVKAVDAAFGVTIPPAAAMLRELMHMGQFIHSHALHFFYLAAPDLLLGPDADPALRNIVGVIGADPGLAGKAIRLRQIGQLIIERVGGRAIHPVSSIPGGMSQPLSHESRYEMAHELAEALELAKLALAVGKPLLAKYAETSHLFANIQTNYMGLVKEGNLELYDGALRLINPAGKTLEQFDPAKYLDFIGEQVEPWTYLKFPYYRKQGYPTGIYRVGPLARLNVSNAIPTELAGKEAAAFKAIGADQPVHETMQYHYARLIELLYAVERAAQLVADDHIISKEVRVTVPRQAGEGIGVIEAPRGTLIHHYKVDDMGRIEKANLLVATLHNNPAIDLSVNEVAKRYITGKVIPESALNMVEMAIRCYDPCLSCATHALGKMPLAVEVRDATGQVVQTTVRELADGCKHS